MMLQIWTVHQDESAAREALFDEGVALEEQMQQATIKQDFETCIRLRSEIAALQ